MPLLYPCRYAREKLSVRESDRRCFPLAFCPKRISVGRAHHYRKRMYSIRRFRTQLTFRRNILHIIVHNTYHTSTWYSVMGIDYYSNSSTSIQQYIRDVVRRAFYLLHFRITAVTVVVAVLTLTHRYYNAVRGHRTGSNNLYSPFSMHGIL